MLTEKKTKSITATQLDHRQQILIYWFSRNEELSSHQQNNTMIDRYALLVKHKAPEDNRSVFETIWH